jgi:hypothetical protein
MFENLTAPQINALKKIEKDANDVGGIMCIVDKHSTSRRDYVNSRDYKGNREEKQIIVINLNPKKDFEKAEEYKNTKFVKPFTCLWCNRKTLYKLSSVYYCEFEDKRFSYEEFNNKKEVGINTIKKLSKEEKKKEIMKITKRSDLK